MVDKRLLDMNSAWTQLLLSLSSKFMFTVDLCTNAVKVTCFPCAVFHGYSFCYVNGVEVTLELHAWLSFFFQVVLYVHHLQYEQLKMLTRGISSSPIFSHDTDCQHCMNISNNKCLYSHLSCEMQVEYRMWRLSTGLG